MAEPAQDGFDRPAVRRNVRRLLLLAACLCLLSARPAVSGGALRATQSRAGEWLLQGTLLLPAQSVALASSWCGGKLPELEFLLRGDPE